MRRAFTLCLLSSQALSSCVQSDLVAIERTAASCEPPGCECSAQVCSSLTTSPDTFCEGSGFTGLSGDSCGGPGGARSHRYAVCSCSDYTASGGLHVDAFRANPEAAVAGKGDVGVNGDFNAGSQVEITGTLRLSGSVMSDQTTPLQTGAGVEEHTAAPCDCAAENRIAVSEVMAQLQSTNDNARISLSERALDGVQGDQVLTLPCGRYFLTRVAASGPVHIHATGRVALAIQTSIELDSSFEITVDPTARLELFVGNNMRVAGAMTLGDVARGQASLRVHIAGAGSLNLQGTSTVAGVLDAPGAELVTAESLTVYGALLVRRAAPGADLTVHYDEELKDGESCRQEGTTSSP